MTGSPRRTGTEVLAALLALATGWVALFGWRGLVEEPSGYLVPAAVGGAIAAGIGVLLRSRHWRWWQVLVVQAAALALFLDEHVSGDLNRWWIVPTRRSVENTAEHLALGGQALATEYSPVPASFVGVDVVLLVGALVLLVAIDLLACTLRRVPLAGLPVLILWMFPISLLTAGLGWRVFAATSLLFVMLLATQESRRVLAWGRQVEGGGRSSRSGSRALALGGATCAAALVLPVFVPLADASFGPGSGEGAGPGDGRSRSIDVHNPFADLRRDLSRPEPTPMLEFVTDARDPRYVRFTVLDEFSGVTWRPSDRQLGGNTPADGDFPRAPGLSNRVDGRETTWHMELRPTFTTSWLPTPYPVRSMSVEDPRWRYDPETLDVADRDGDRFRGRLEYDVVGFEPEYAATDLHTAVPPPDDVVRSMTRLPDGLPPVIRRTALGVTAGATSDYEKARLLQDWFRNDGGFSYSLDRAPGSGMLALTEFITTDKVGYCEQFAAAFGVMARSLELPTRVVVGFLRPDDIGEDRYLYTSDNLHAWPEVYFTGYGWVRFEPTPSNHTGDAPRWTTQDLPGATAAPSPTAAPTTAPTQAPDLERDQGGGRGDEGGPGVLPWLGLVVLLLTAGVPWLLRRRQRHERLAAGPGPAEVANGLWAELRATVHDLGLEWPEGRSVRRQARTLLKVAVPEPALAERIDALVLFVERARYARPSAAVDATERAAHSATVAAWSALIGGTLPAWQRHKALLLPRSVWSQPAGLGPAETAQVGSGAAEEDLVEVGRQ